jgi:hypothetical protein
MVGKKDSVFEKVTGLTSKKTDPKDLDKTPPIDHFTYLAKAILSVSPAGTMITSLMSDYIPSAKQARIIKFIKEISDDLKNLEIRVEEDYLNKDQISYVLEESIRGAAKYYQKEKLDYYRGVLVNTIKLNPKDEVDYYLYLIDALSAVHLRILAILYDPYKYFSDNGLSSEKVRGYSISLVFKEAFQDIDFEVVRSAFNDLYRLNLTNTDASIFGTITAGTGLELVKGRVKPVGKSFVKFCKDYHQ